MDFDRAMNVRVNGKEVNRVAFNGVTIWEKYTPASILLESDKSYASEGDTINLTATVYDKFGRGCPDKNVEFINNDTSELIATATTNSNGIATVSYLVKDTNPLYIKAKINNFNSNILHPLQTFDLTSFLTDTINYSFVHDSAQNANSKYEVTSANELRVYYRTQLQFLTEFIDTDKYTLEFDMKNSEGYDAFITLNGYTIYNQQYSWIIVGGTRYNATPRYTSYIHVIVTRDGDTFTTNLNNGQYIVTGTFENVTNILNVSKYGYSSNSSVYVKNLKITC